MALNHNALDSISKPMVPQIPLSIFRRNSIAENNFFFFLYYFLVTYSINETFDIFTYDSKTSLFQWSVVTKKVL